MPAHFGLDIGSYSLKLIQAKKEKKGYRLETFGEVRTPVDLQSGADRDKVALVEAIKKLVADCKTRSRDVAISLPETEVFSQVIELPVLSRTELASAIKLEAEQYIPVPLEEVQLEHVVLNGSSESKKSGKMEILLIGARKQALDKRVNILQEAGLTPIAAETDLFSLVRSLPFDSQKTSLLLDVGFKSTNIAVVQKQNLRFIRTIKTGGEALTRAVAKSLNMEFNQAEQYKVNYGLDRSQLEGKVAAALETVFSVILQEVRRSQAFFSQNNPNQQIDLLVLSGGGAELPGLSGFLAKAFNLEVIVADPFVNFIKDEKFPKIKGVPRFSVAVGLSLRSND